MGLFDVQIARKPNHYPWSQDIINAIWSGHWTPNEFSFKSDYGDFKTRMTEVERQIIVRDLSAIAQIEVAVKRFWAKLGDNLPHPSMYDLGYAISSTEVIHNQAYEKLLDTLGITDVFEDNLKEPVIAGRVNYLTKYLNKVYTDSRKQYLYSLVLFTLFVENVSLFSQFYVVMWFNRFKNMLKDTAQQVQYTKNEEALHAMTGTMLINTIKAEYPELWDEELTARIYHESSVAYNAECAIIDWIVGAYSEPHLSASILKDYVAYRINNSLVSIGLQPQLHVEDPDSFRWMIEEEKATTMSDFFHKRPVNYKKAHRTFDEDDIFND